MQPEAIMFDLGGVLVDLDYSLPAKHFEKMGVPGISDIFFSGAFHDLLRQYERGEISTAHFFAGIKKRTGLDLPEVEMTHAWNSIILDFPEHRIELLRELRKKYRLLLFSNINELHLAAFRALIEKKFPGLNFEALFEKTYYSNEIGLRKPEPEAFSYILKQHKLKPQSVLFVDDVATHVDAAKKLGIQGRHLQLPGDDISDKIRIWLAG